MEMYTVLILSSFIAALISGAAGFGGALLLLPVLTLYAGAELAIPVLTIAQLIGNLSRMAFGLNQIEWKKVFLFSMTAVPLSALGAFGFSISSKSTVTRIIGAVLILFVFLRYFRILKFKPNDKTLVLGGAVTGLLSGLAGSAGPIGAAVFLSFGLPPVAYIASEAATATAMHITKIIVYGKLVNLPPNTINLGLIMGLAMIFGTYAANRLIKNMKKEVFQKYVAVLLCVVGAYMLI
ncbi:sulfite exporter TauE/SafE family protein [Methanosarcina sp. UBA289]|uniref:sulfite exporter TauE/SafE family protein n=1 Tax=Methanosarcina sp. UBA289 TaxID=1915574 RepID=UPI0025EAB1B9|nr:sulfite exporter TauE/SafE family protein [Methanosarcina sp. UBA289]